MNLHYCKRRLRSLSCFRYSPLVVLGLVFLGISAAQAAPPEPYLVKNINPGPDLSYPLYLTDVNGTLFFQADDGVHGRELYKSDGTETGTVLVKDINPGSGESYPSYLSNVNDTLFFRVDDGVHSNELWKSDGTEAGTVLVKDINLTGSSFSDWNYLTNVNDTLFFVADDGVHGEELWKSDGTAAGTVLVKDIYPGGVSSLSGNLSNVNVNGKLFFGADDGVYGEELWMSDGTDMGTVRVSDINQGAGDADLAYLTNVNGALFFRAYDSAHGSELWARNPGVDLAISKKVITSTAFLLPRDAISYTLTYRNVGDAAASGVVISDLLPDSLTQFSVSSSGAAITYAVGVTYTWQVEDLEPGEGGVISITAVIDPAFAGGVLSSTATISSSRAAEANGDNNSSAAAVTVQPPALRAFKTVQGPGGTTFLLLPNDIVTYFSAGGRPGQRSFRRVLRFVRLFERVLGQAQCTGHKVQ